MLIFDIKRYAINDGPGIRTTIFMQFEPLTLCPIDKRPIIREQMTQEKIDWLNQYHQTVYDRLLPHLDSDEVEWLREACEAI